MGIKIPEIIPKAKGMIRQKSRRLSGGHLPLSRTATMGDVPKGHLAVYVGLEYKNRFVVPIAYLKHPVFQDLLKAAEEEYGFDPPMGGLTLPCSEETFLDVTSDLGFNYKKFISY
ncbi:Auxin-responsive protein SAUR20-like protein [Drosera capensis]